ncbi:MAG: nitroreductase family protein, partial [Stackebrandtia sp.]
MSSRHAVTSQPIHPLLATRHSTRAFDRDVALTEPQIAALLEAARWAPSCGNTQPARFIVARKDTEVFKRVLGTLDVGNQGWARYAALLVVGVRLVSNDRGPLPLPTYGLSQA